MGSISRKAFRAATILAFAVASSQFPAVAKADTVTASGALLQLFAPLYIADQQGFFGDYGVDTKVLPFSTGRASQEAIVGGAVKWGTVAETPAMFAYANGLPVRVIGVMAAYEVHSIVGAPEIKTVKDLVGKRVGIVNGATPDYILGEALSQAGIDRSEVKAINLTPTDMVSSLSNGQIDAFIWVEPLVSKAVELGRGKFHSVLIKDFVTYGTVEVLESTLSKEPDMLVRSLCALKAAANYMKENKEKAISVVAAKLNMDEKIVAAEWERMPLEISLDRETLVSELGRQHKWAVGSGLLPATSEPVDFHGLVNSSIYEKTDDCPKYK